MAAETWLTAAEAVEMGFADKIEKPVKMAALVAVVTSLPLGWRNNIRLRARRLRSGITALQPKALVETTLAG
jgi:DNA-binding NtrC family response regulator